MQPLWIALSTYAQAALDWVDRHPGLGGWVGAIGAILAIFVTWYLARREYLRTVRQQTALREVQIDLVLSIISDFESLLQGYVGLVHACRPEAINFHAHHSSDAEYNGMIDLAQLTVVNWPSLQTFVAFKRYWSRSLRVLETSQSQPINTDVFRLRLRQHDEALANLTDALEAVRKI